MRPASSYATPQSGPPWRLIIIGIVFAVMLIGAIVTTGCASVPPGYVGIKVSQYGSQRGVQDYPLQTGAVFYWRPVTDVEVFPTFTQRIVYDNKPDEPAEAIDFRSSDKATLVADVAMTFNLRAEKVPHIFVTFRQDLSSLERGIIRDRLRSAFQHFGTQHSTMDLLGEAQTVLEGQVLAAVQKDLEPHGVHIDTIQIISKPKIDATVETSITALLTAIQQTKTAEQRVKQVEMEGLQAVARSEAAKRAAVIDAEAAAQVRLLGAKADADSNRLLNESMNDRLLQLEAMKRWNGVLPTMMGSGQVPFIKVN